MCIFLWLYRTTNTSPVFLSKCQSPLPASPAMALVLSQVRAALHSRSSGPRIPSLVGGTPPLCTSPIPLTTLHHLNTTRSTTTRTTPHVYYAPAANATASWTYCYRHLSITAPEVEDTGTSTAAPPTCLIMKEGLRGTLAGIHEEDMVPWSILLCTYPIPILTTCTMMT